MQLTARVVVTGKVVGRIVSVAPIPGATYNRLAVVDVGEVRPRSIMWGGIPHLKPGDLVGVALPGARLENGAKVRRRHWNYDLRVESEGILLSRHEAGLPDSPEEVPHDRVMRLAQGNPGDSLDDA